MLHSASDIGVCFVQMTIGLFALMSNTLVLVVLAQPRMRMEFAKFRKYLAFICVSEVVLCSGFLFFNVFQLIIDALLKSKLNTIESTMIQTQLKQIMQVHDPNISAKALAKNPFRCAQQQIPPLDDVSIPRFDVDSFFDDSKNVSAEKISILKVCGDIIAKQINEDNKIFQDTYRQKSLLLVDTVKAFYHDDSLPGFCHREDFPTPEDYLNMNYYLYLKYSKPAVFQFSWILLKIIAPLLFSLLCARNWTVSVITLARVELINLPAHLLRLQVFRIKRIAAFITGVSLCVLIYCLSANFYCNRVCVNHLVQALILSLSARSIPIIFVIVGVIIIMKKTCIEGTESNPRRLRVTKAFMVFVIFFAIFEATSDVALLVDHALPLHLCVSHFATNYLDFLINFLTMLNSFAHIFALSFSNKLFRIETKRQMMKWFTCTRISRN